MGATRRAAKSPPDAPTELAPPPRRDKVDRAEAALAEARDREAKELVALDKEREAIERKLEAVKRRQAKAMSALEERLDKARAEYRAALDKWSG
jgi:erythromycin esterase-like protein